ncbi:MAG: hypothetical protein JXJ17_09505 [Anaerolineae bacterium]|nr:hypothetical protein [Anaerolineae bacterium]
MMHTVPGKDRQPVPQGEDGVQNLLPVEVEVYIDPDGAVTFADLEASLISVAEKLDGQAGADRDAVIED